ncbi:hypothetical protein E4195_15940 [Pseudomonas putida]|nr:hypothetical protein E4195_15940 [Pseudomonas putida]
MCRDWAAQRPRDFGFDAELSGAATRPFRDTRSPCRSGFTREYGSGVNGERRVEIGQQARPFRG